MAKNSLIGGSIWEEYSQKVQDLMNHPRNMGELTEEDEKKLTLEQKIIYDKVKQYVSESEVTQEIKEDLEKLGWSVLTFDMEQLRKESVENFNEKTKELSGLSI